MLAKHRAKGRPRGKGEIMQEGKKEKGRPCRKERRNPRQEAKASKGDVTRGPENIVSRTKPILRSHNGDKISKP